MMMSFNKANTDDHAVENVYDYYGSDEFIVKVQIGLGGVMTSIPNMLYDRLKKVNFSFDDDEVKRKVQTDGYGKVKAYFRAKHAPNGKVELFLDRMPDQNQAW